MKKHLSSIPVCWLLALLCTFSSLAQQHTATRLGYPSTRFADPLVVPDDARRLFASEKLARDIDFIARESGFKGNLNDLRRAAASSNIVAIKIPKGTIMPAMSTRRGGKPVLLREVLWAGKEPIDAYEFRFISEGRNYRVVIPKPCANFWVEDHGKELKPLLALKCLVPQETAQRSNFDVCLALSNSGDGTEQSSSVYLLIPQGAQFVGATAGGEVVEGHVRWQLPALRAGASTNVCATFTANEPMTLSFASSAVGRASPRVTSQCDTRIIGISAILIELVDVTDPIEVGEIQTYRMFVLNQGSSKLTNVKVVCKIDREFQEFVSGWSVHDVSTDGATIRLDPLPHLDVHKKAIWEVDIKMLKAGDIRFTMEVTTDEFQNPIVETESTQQY